MVSNPIQYVLFPYTILSERESRHLSVLLPCLSVLQVIRPPAVPNRLREQVTGWPVVTEPEQIEAIKRCLKGYQQFAAVHGENSVLASLSLDQISRDFAETRFRIQTQLKKNDADESENWETLLLEAAIFLELARDLDEKEAEQEASLTHIDNLEGKFREILGISDEEDRDDAAETLSPPLRAEQSYLSFMLPKRIESWLRLFFNRMPEACPILVTTAEQVLEELFEPVRAEYERTGRTFEPSRIVLGSFPALDDLPPEDFLSLLGNPEASGLVASYWRCLESVLLSPHDLSATEQMSQAADTLQDYLHHYRKEAGRPEGAEIQMEVVFDSELRWSTLRKYCERAGKSEQLVETSCPDDLVKILVCQL